MPGYQPWTPDRTTEQILAQVNAVLEEYAAHLPLTIRQIFYRLVGAHGYPKLEKDYKPLCVYLKKARRARMIAMTAIRDDYTRLAPYTHAGVEDFLTQTRLAAEQMLLDRSLGQAKRVVVMCEAAGMAPQLERVAAPFGIPVYSSSGFDSLTVKFGFAKEFAESDRPVEVLHIGDYDPSGQTIFNSLEADVTSFVAQFADDAQHDDDEVYATNDEVQFTRLAVTPAQIRQYRLPTAPPKATDVRGAFTDNRTCQAEALPPNTLAEILLAAITDPSRFDRQTYEQVLREEQSARKALLKVLP